jgi:hypothetical protein
MSKLAKRAFSLVDGEWILRHYPNSGGVVAVRALLISLLAFSVAIGVDSYLAPESKLTFDPVALASAIRSHWTWLGAMYGAAYVALYSRFAAQWTYLAGQYNQLMAAEEAEPRATLPALRRSKRVLRWAAFIEDAVAMHLSAKASYSSVIATLLVDPEIRDEYATSSIDEPNRLQQLEARLLRSLGADQLSAISTAGTKKLPTSRSDELPASS